MVDGCRDNQNNLGIRVRNEWGYMNERGCSIHNKGIRSINEYGLSIHNKRIPVFK